MPDKDLTPADISANRAALRHVKDWLKWRKKSQKALAVHLGMSEPSVSKWLAGKQNMTVAQFVRLAAFLGAEPNELMFPPNEREKADRYQRIALALQSLTETDIDALATIAESMASKRGS